MDLAHRLQNPHSKAAIVRLSKEIVDDETEFETVWELTIEGDNSVSARAAWLLDHLIQRNPALLQPYLSDAVSELGNTSHSDGVLRSLAKAMASLEIPVPLQSRLYGVCRDHLLSSDTAIAVRVHCMEMASRIAEPFPELCEEMRQLIGEAMRSGAPAICSRGRRILRRLDAGKMSSIQP